MSEEKRTKAQSNAIHARGGTLLVSAAAGSGKTTVLVDRIVSMLTDPVHPVDADRLVVVTFTKAAAAEMRARLDREISKLMRERPDDLALRRQRMLLQKARIDTIHGFCSDCLREFFAEAGIAPDFQIADEGEMRVLRSETLAQVIEDGYSTGGEAFRTLVEMMGEERGDRKLTEILGGLIKHVSAYPDPEAKLSELAAVYEQDIPFEQTDLGRSFLRYCADLFGYLVDQTDRACDELTCYPEIDEKYGKAFSADREIFEKCWRLAKAGDMDGLRAAAAEGFAGLKQVRNCTVPEIKNRIQKARDARKKKLTNDFSQLLRLCDSFSADSVALRSVIGTLCGMAADYCTRLAEQKAERKLLDFDDLEHMAAKLLFKREGDGWVRTGVASELAGRFDEILIDEYQDTNYTQDLIFRAISNEPGRHIGEGGNLFLVGDIKQSIYSFRKAVPKLFLERLDAYPLYDKAAPVFPCKIILDRNFRSRPEVTGAVNFIFTQLMTKERGGIDYTDGQQLFSEGTFPPSEGQQTELHILAPAAGSEANEPEAEGREEASSSDDAAETEDLTRVGREALYCARLAASLIGKAMVTDKVSGSLRTARPGDICILRRKMRGEVGQAYIDQFSALGIPCLVGAGEGFFAASEVMVMLSLLRAIDNPLLDIPLAAALRSPIFGFDTAMLAELRAQGSKRSVYASLLARAHEGNEDCVRALELLRSLRNASCAMTCDRLLTHIYDTTGYLAAVQAMPGGEGRRGNLLMLLELARRSEASGSRGLAGLLRMLDHMEQEGGTGSAQAAQSDCVTVRSIHSAKGLQFPICIVTGLGDPLNTRINSEPVPIHGELGLSAYIYDVTNRMRRHTIHRKVVINECIADQVDEELRVLYVALTRAVDKLIMVAIPGKKAAPSRAAEMVFEYGISPTAIKQERYTFLWILACALRHPDNKAYADAMGILYPPAECAAPLDLRFVGADSPMLAPPAREELPEGEECPPDPALTEGLCASMDFAYEFAELRRVPAKVTASQTHLHNAGIGDVRPSFMGEQGLSPTERGTALHRFMQFCDLARARADAAAEVRRLVEGRFITAREGEAVDTDRVRALFAGSLGAMIAEADECRREWRFSAELTEKLLCKFTDASPQGERVVLEGECDLLLISGGSVRIIDYKTDRVRSTDELIKRYSDQLELYAYAVAQITGLRVERPCLYSFELSELREL